MRVPGTVIATILISCAVSKAYAGGNGDGEQPPKPDDEWFSKDIAAQCVATAVILFEKSGSIYSNSTYKNVRDAIDEQFPQFSITLREECTAEALRFLSIKQP